MGSQEHAELAPANDIASHVPYSISGMNNNSASFEQRKTPIVFSKSGPPSANSYNSNNFPTPNARSSGDNAPRNTPPPLLNHAPSHSHDSTIYTHSPNSRHAEPSLNLNPHSASKTLPTPCASTSAVPASTPATLEDRLQHVLSAARAMGFESLDMLLLQYYTQPLEHNACLLEIQRRSRRRDLRVLLNQLARSAQSWSAREAQGFEETVLTTAEGIMGREAGEYLLAHEGSQSPALMEAGDEGLKMSHLRDELPNTWSMLYETARSFFGTEKESSNFVRAAMNNLIPGA